MPDLFSPILLGDLQLSNRIIMAPLTRMRAKGGLAGPLHVLHYAQRSSPGSLLIQEATVVNETGEPYRFVPKMYTQEHCDSWKPVCQAVHEKGSFIYLQLWHAGRVSRKRLQPNGQAPVSASATRVGAGGDLGKAGDVARALTTQEVKQYIQDYRRAARLAREAGFDGVEIHGANGYLPHQFTESSTNKRDDEYGGSIEKRARFLFEIVAECSKEFPPSRIGVRLSPFGFFNDMFDESPIETYTYILKEMNKYKIGFVHFIEPRLAGDDSEEARAGFSEGETSKRYNKDIVSLKCFQGLYTAGKTMIAGGYTPASGNQVIKDGTYDMVAYGRHYISNPDIVSRMQRGLPLAHYNRKTFYGPNVPNDFSVGYVDYPTWEEDQAAQKAKL
ncbi:hypothetical protein SmJEL517_g04815 [Synchytrium microbalum]|uniref:NADH:flavin oxidoreductase/NADH oxidase N-terminal domain-containing protein n=1 Tax=Synchytrium microbalum TaxID=1806994 RepID=A0A507BX20_9FUNG|nr:uncharacterized protein SmJEL517_g04815 [Synchytrium microbalum]TPX31982.1 hypothetical protein SmJEL517_g04815 [Synchytrium microbalum]